MWQRYWDAVEMGWVANPIPKTIEEAAERAQKSYADMWAAGAFRFPDSPYVPGHPSPVTLWLVLTGQSIMDANIPEEDTYARATEATEQG